TDPTGNLPVVAAGVTLAIVIASGPPGWVVAVAVVGASLAITGYFTHNAVLQTIGQVMLGFAGGLAGGAGFLAGQGWTGGLGAGGVAASATPLSPLPDGVKTVINLAYVGQSALKAIIDGYQWLNDVDKAKETATAEAREDAWEEAK